MHRSVVTRNSLKIIWPRKALLSRSARYPRIFIRAKQIELGATLRVSASLRALPQQLDNAARETQLRRRHELRCPPQLRRPLIKYFSGAHGDREGYKAPTMSRGFGLYIRGAPFQVECARWL